MAGDSAPDDDEPRTDTMIGQVLASRYEIEVLLGEGAMGAVYKARHVKVGRAFAVKILHRKLLEDKKVAQRFGREAELAGRLRHPNVIGVVDVGETPDGLSYMVMDFAEGLDLATLLGEAPMPPERIINLTRQLLEGLYHAHEQGLIHRDFKPENVIIELDDHETEVPRIVDFGIAILREGGDNATGAGRLTTNGLVLGTPHYMAPEQAVADPIDHRIDLFALGIVIYEMLCGKLPFDGTGAEVARANLLLDPPLIAQRVPFLEVDPLLEAFARRLMAKKRDQRPATAKAARELLDLISSDRPAAAVALGVPVAIARAPAITQPVEPQSLAVGRGDLPLVSAASDSAAKLLRSTGREAPAVVVAQAAAKPFDAGRSQLSVETDMSEPLRYGEGSRRKTWLIAGLATFGLAALLTVVVIKTTGDDKPKASDDQKLVMGSATAPMRTPGRAREPAVPAGSTTVPATGGGSGTSGTTEPAAGSSTTGPATGTTTEPAAGTTVPATGSTTTEPAATEPAATEPAATGPADASVTEPAAGSNPTVATAVKPRPRTPPLPKVKPSSGSNAVETGSGAAKVAVVTPPPGITSDDVYKLYGAVGLDLAAARKVSGEGAISRVAEQYRLIQIQDGVSTPAKREATAAKLGQLRAALAPLKKQ